MSVAAVSRATLLKSRLDRFSRAVSGTEKGDPQSLHRARVASRRLRELVPAIQLDGDVARKLGRLLRKVTIRLGSVRELDVLILLIDELHVSRPVHEAALGRARAGVTKEREAARKRLRAQKPSDDMRRVARKLDRVVDDLRRAEGADGHRPRRGSPERSLAWAVDARIANRAARLREAMTHAGAVYLPERLHTVRIAVKKLRYASELRADIRGESRTPLLAMLKRVQGLLGRMHDLQVLIDRVRDLQASLSPPSLAVWREMDALVLELDDMCRRLHARYVRERDLVEAAAAKHGAAPPAGTPREWRVG